MSEHTSTERIAFISSTGKVHTVNCVTVQHWYSGGPRGHGAPDLQQISMAEAMESIDQHAWSECGRCRTMRLKSEREHRTADGDTAVRLSNATGNTWLVRSVVQIHVVEIPADARIEDFTFDASTKWHVWAEAHRLYANEIDADARRAGVRPGWRIDYGVNGGVIGPLRSRVAVEEQIREMAPEMGGFFSSAKPQPEISESHAELRAEWSRVWVITENEDNADTLEYRAAWGAASDASQEMVRRGLWASTIGPSSSDPTWETWHEIALDYFGAEVKTYDAQMDLLNQQLES